jgi:hypothetical protein
MNNAQREFSLKNFIFQKETLSSWHLIEYIFFTWTLRNDIEQECRLSLARIHVHSLWAAIFSCARNRPRTCLSFHENSTIMTVVFRVVKWN